MTRLLTRLSVLFMILSVLFGCGSSGNTTDVEEERPLLQCEADDQDDYMAVTVSATSLQLDLLRSKALSRGQARLASRVQTTVQNYFSEERSEEIERSFSSGTQGQAVDSLRSAITRVSGQVLSGAEMIQCDTFEGEKGGTKYYEIDARVGIPVGEAATDWAKRVRANPSLQEAFENQSELEGVIQEWLKWSLTQDVGSGSSSQGSGPN